MGGRIGRVVESVGDKVTFILEAGAVSYGGIVKILCDGIVYYARVYNSESGTTLSTEDQLRLLAGKEDYGPYSEFRKVSSQVFLEREKDDVRPPTLNPPFKAPVFQVDEEDQTFLRLGGGLTLGQLRVGRNRLFGSVGIDIQALSKMIGVFGKTGAGKTNTELLLNARIAENPKTVGLIFDFAGELFEGKGIGKGLRDHPLFPTRISYFPPKKIIFGLKSIYPSNLPDLFPDITIHQKRLAERLYQNLGDDWIVTSLKEYADGDWKDVKKLAGKAGNKLVIEALMVKLLVMRGKMWNESKENFTMRVVDDLQNGVTCLVDISGLSADEQSGITLFTARQCAKVWKKKWETDHDYWERLPSLLITLEEAHQFLEERDTFFSDLCLRYRKYRVGLAAVTPRPALINDDVFAELWTKIIMKTDLKKDRDYITRNTPYLEYSDTEVKMLNVGQALLVSEPKTPFAVPVQVTHYPEYLKGTGKPDYRLPPSKPLTKIDQRIKKIRHAGELLTRTETVRLR